MNRKSILAGVLLALGGLFAGCWWFATRPGPAVLAPAPGGAAEELGSEPAMAELPAGTRGESLPAPARDERERSLGLAANPETGPAEAIGTTILVVDAQTEKPVERFAIRISRVRLTTGNELVRRDRLREFPGGALVVANPLEGFCYSIQAPGYVDQAGSIETVSSVDRRALIRLERKARVRGRVVFEGRPLPAMVSVMLEGHSWKFEQAEADDEGVFEFEDLPKGKYTVEVWKKSFELPSAEPPFELVENEFELKAGEQLDLGDLVVFLPEPVAEKPGGGKKGKRLPSNTNGLFVDAGEFWAYDDDSWTTLPSGAKMFRKRPASDGHARVRATDGGVPLVGAVVLLRKEGASSATRVGTTDEAGELLVEMSSGKPHTLELSTSNLLYLGRTEFPVQVLPEQELEIWLPVHTGSLAIEIPEDFRPGPDRALQILFESTVLPEPGYEMLTLRGLPEECVEPGITWTGNRCELEALAPGHYRIRADVQEKAKSERSGGWKPTETSFEGEVRVCGGGSATCVLRRE